MTTSKPEVVAWRWRKPIVNDQGETVGATAWELGDAPEFLPWWTNEPLIRLSDYESLQAECEKLRKDAERHRSLLESVLREIPHRKWERGNAPGHGHSVPGIWDKDNGALAGKECAWCKVWNYALDAMLDRTHQSDKAL